MRRHVVTPANVHDSRVLSLLLCLEAGGNTGGAAGSVVIVSASRDQAKREGVEGLCQCCPTIHLMDEDLS